MEKFDPRICFRAALLVIAMLMGAAKAQGADIVGGLEFFGYGGLDLKQLRRAVPFQPGDALPDLNSDAADDIERRIIAALESPLKGRRATVTLTCCDTQQRWLIYIGVPGTSAHRIEYRAEPRGKTRLPKDAVDAYSRFMELVHQRVTAGSAAPSPEEAGTKEAATRNAGLLRDVLESSDHAEHRAAAAHLLGLLPASKEQIEALLRASTDAKPLVRNNAVRALAVLAEDKEIARQIAPDPFIAMLRSMDWTDRNKALWLLTTLTASRDPAVLRRLRDEALESLREMAQWKNAGHADAARLLFGRAMGIEEARLQELIKAERVDEILSAAK